MVNKKGPAFYQDLLTLSQSASPGEGKPYYRSGGGGIDSLTTNLRMGKVRARQVAYYIVFPKCTLDEVPERFTVLQVPGNTGSVNDFVLK